MALKPITVSQLNEYIKNLLQNDPLLRFVRVSGDITSIKFHSNGNVYLTISDVKSKLECVVFNNRIDETVKSLQEGDRVVLEGSIGGFAAAGKYSLWVKNVEIAGEGELAKEFERLKQKLSKEGLFDKGHKKELPKYPNHIGVVTSDTGAAVRDIIKILTSRTKLTDITVFSVLVQGSSAAQSIVNMLELIDRDYNKKIDLLILGRGGGSPEDLAVFNDESLARAIFKCSIPIISAVGHEIDTSISDLVADLRAETPTAAAQIAVRSMEEIMDEMESSLDDLNTYLNNRLMVASLNMEGYKRDLERNAEGKIRDYSEELSRHLLVLKENDPRTVMEKGFAIVTGDGGKPISKVSSLKSGKKYKITLTDGSKNCLVE